MTQELKEYKKEIPELERIKKCLKEQCHERKQCLNDIKKDMLGSNGLAVRESLIEDINSLREKVQKLEEELAELTKE